MSELSPRHDLEAYRHAPAVVLGTTGFIGRWIARALTLRGADLYLIARDQPRAEQICADYQIQGTIIRLDLENFASLQHHLTQIRPAITFNAAGYGVDRHERDRRLAYRINCDLVRTLVETLRHAASSQWPGGALIHLGSALEYGKLSNNLAEDSTPHPTTLYGKSKLAGTLALRDFCQQTGLRGLTARLFTVYGPGEHAGRLLPSLLESAAKRSPLAMTAGMQARDFTYVEDVAEGLLRLGLCDAPPGEIVNLATGTLTTVRQFAETAARLLEIPPGLLQFGAIPTRQEEMAHEPVSITRLLALTGWRPKTSIADGIRKTMQFIQKGRSEVA